MRAAIAIRVSPRPQDNVRYSPEIQEQQCREWCAANGHEVVAVISDILISGGSKSRFSSIFAAIEEHSPELFVVADLSRWTRDTPTRYYAMRAILEDAGIRLASVSEPVVGSDMPFSDTITTAMVESNNQQLMLIRAKTSVGVRKAWAAGKRFGNCFGWTMTRDGWTWDEPRIRALYQDWIDGVPIREMSLRHGIHAQAVKTHIRAKRQRDVVPDLWDRAQVIERPRSMRTDARHGAVYRGLLVCPFCGWMMRQVPSGWGVYRCPRFYEPSHEWLSLSTRKWVTPAVADILARTEVPQAYAKPPVNPLSSTPDTTMERHREMDRLSEAWSKGRLTTERYEAAISRLEQEPVSVPLPEPDMEMVRQLSVLVPYLDCDGSRWHEHTCDRCPRERENGEIVNAVLRSFLEHILVQPDRTVRVKVQPQYADWMMP